MRTSIVSLFLFIINSPGACYAQTVEVASFQHAVRWVSESNFPNYLQEKDAQDSVLSTVEQCLKQQYHAETIHLPAVIDYRYISSFGKANLKKPRQDGSPDFKVGVLSFLTRATVGYAVLWKMEVVVQQKDQTVFENKTEHELEYFSPTGYMSSTAWMKKEDFTQLFSDLLRELLQTGDTLAKKITIGSAEEKEAEVKKLLGNSEPYLLKINGSFLQGQNFIASIQQENEKPDTVMYRDGWEQSNTKIGFSEVTARLLHEVTGLNIEYDLKSKEIRFGRLEYAGGRKLKLRMEWMEATKKTTDGQVWSVSQTSPMIVEMYSDKELVAFYTYALKPADTTVSFRKSLSGLTIHQLEGFHNGIPVSVVYDPGNELVFLNYDHQLKLVMVLQNINPASRSFNGYTLSKNKTTMGGISKGFGKPKLKGTAEWYHLFYDASSTRDQAAKLLEPLLMLFFGIGNSND